MTDITGPYGDDPLTFTCRTSNPLDAEFIHNQVHLSLHGGIAAFAPFGDLATP
jgi:hypothetical protein